MMFPRRFLACEAVFLAVLCGCSTVSKLEPGKKEAQQHAQQLQALQLEVMRFADQYVGRSREAINRFQAGLQDPQDRLAAQNWKVQQAVSAYTIASGPNAVTNALDMVVLASLSRMVVEDTWKNRPEGAHAMPLQETHRSLEDGAWQLVKGVLTEDQLTKLHLLIAEWRAEHPNVRAVAYVHFVDFARAVGAAGGNDQGRGSLLSLVGIDPFTQLDPAVREIAQTRELAERTIYYLQRMPDLLDMQVERLTYQVAVMPETKALVSAADRISLVGSASQELVSNLPAMLDQQREALIAQLTRTLNSESATVGALAGELRSTLQAGTDTATAVNTMLETVHQITSQFARQPGSAPGPQQQGPPFDIRHYTAMLEAATTTSRELNTLAQHADSILPILRSATQDATASLKEAENHLFVLLVLLVFAAAAAALLAALAYRQIVARLERREAVR
jgi:hypothetical protein